MKTQIKSNGLSSRLRTRGLNTGKLFLILDRAGQLGVKALEQETPKETGQTASKWSYTVSKDLRLTFKNAEVTEFGVPIPKILMYGYTRGRHHIPGDDFVRRALDPIIRSMKEEIRKELL